MVQFWARARHLFVSKASKRAQRPTQPLTVFTLGPFPWLQSSLRHEAVHSPPSRTKTRMTRSLPSLPHIPSWHAHRRLYVYLILYKGTSWHSDDRLECQTVRVQFLVTSETFSLPHCSDQLWSIQTPVQ